MTFFSEGKKKVLNDSNLASQTSKQAQTNSKNQVFIKYGNQITKDILRYSNLIIKLFLLSP
jgi:hypothetical protein